MRVNGKYHCANMCECRMVTKSGKFLTFSVKKRKEPTVIVLEDLSEKV